MNSRLKIALLAGGLLLGLGVVVWGQAPPGTTTSSVNPAPGSLWTYLGPTLGADWTTPPGVSNAPQPAHYFYAGPTSGANAVPTFRPIGNGDIPSGITIDNLNMTGIPTAPTAAAGTSTTQIATTAFVTSRINALSGCPSIIGYGGVADDATDNTPAWTAAVAANSCISFPPGTFRFNTGLTYIFSATNNRGITVRGSGQDVTVLHFPGAVGNALGITKTQFAQSVHVSDLTMTTGTHNADTAIYVTNTWPGIGVTLQAGFAPNDVTRVTLRSDQGYTTGGPGAPTTITNSWKNGIYLFNDGVWNLNEILMYGPTPPSGGTPAGYPISGGGAGNGIVLEGNNSHLLPVIYNIDKSNFQWTENGVLIRSWIQGVNISQSNFSGGFTGVAVPSGVIGMSQLTITGSQLNNANNVWVQSRVQQLMISNSLFLIQYGSYGLIYELAPFEGTVITGNYFLGLDYNGGTGIVFNPIKGGTDMPPVVSGNGFFSLLYGLDLRGQLTGLIAGGNQFFDSHGAKIINTATAPDIAPFNMITGSGNSQYGGPLYATVTGVVSNGLTPPSPRLTVNSTNAFVTGQVVLAGGMAGITGVGSNEFKSSSIVVVDGTHMDLVDLTWLAGNAYTSGGSVTSLPP